MPDDRRIPRRPSARELRAYRVRGLLMLGEGETPSAADMHRIRRIRRLRRDLGLSYESIDIVLRLVDRLETAEADGGEPRPTARITVVAR